ATMVGSLKPSLAPSLSTMVMVAAPAGAAQRASKQPARRVRSFIVPSLAVGGAGVRRGTWCRLGGGLADRAETAVLAARHADILHPAPPEGDRAAAARQRELDRLIGRQRRSAQRGRGVEMARRAEGRCAPRAGLGIPGDAHVRHGGGGGGTSSGRGIAAG